MSRQAIGICLLAVSAFLFGVKYLTAAVFSVGRALQGVGATQLSDWFSNIGILPTALAAISMCVGLGFLVWGEITRPRK